MKNKKNSREKLLKLLQLNGQINSQDNLSTQFHSGSNGQQLQEQLGKMFIPFHIWNKILGQIMLGQEIECYHYSNIQTIDNSSVHILHQILMMHLHKFTMNAQHQHLIKMLGFMLILLTVEMQHLFTVSIRQEQLNVKRNYQLFIEFPDTLVYMLVKMEFILHTMEDTNKCI